jgi:hypothetical protein
VPRRNEILMAIALLAVITGGLALTFVTVSGRTAQPTGTTGKISGQPFTAAGTARLCQSQRTAFGGYSVQNNEWGSGAAECISARGGGFTVTNSAISNSTSGAPGGYPSIYKGCHWGACTPASGLPIQVADLAPGRVTTSWTTTQPGTGAYDIWFNRTPVAAGQPDGTELMVWLNHNGPVQPFGSQVATATIGGRGYDVWYGKQAWNTVSYTMTTPAISVTGLDIGALAADAVSRGYIGKSWYLIDVEAGFELWRGGAGLATDSFTVNTGGAAGRLPLAAGSTTPASGTPGGPATGTVTSCTIRYAVTHSWPGDFQTAVTVVNTGTTAVNGWSLRWAFPGDQRVSQLWNGSQAQSGQQVTVGSAAYNAALPPSGTATFGFRLNGTPCQG